MELAIFNGIAATFIVIIFLFGLIKFVSIILSSDYEIGNSFLVLTITQWCLSVIASIVIILTYIDTVVSDPLVEFFYLTFFYIFIGALTDFAMFYYG